MNTSHAALFCMLAHFSTELPQHQIRLRGGQPHSGMAAGLNNLFNLTSISMG